MYSCEGEVLIFIFEFGQRFVYEEGFLCDQEEGGKFCEGKSVGIVLK